MKISNLLDRFLLLLVRKRINLIVFKAFIGPFFISFSVIQVILLVWKVLQYQEHLLGKGLGISVYLELFGYISIMVASRAFPLTVMMSSLVAYGGLSQHSELTAIKSSGISLLKVLKPIFVFSILLTIGAFTFNEYVLPWGNLRAYRLLYDIKTKNPSFELKEGVIYKGIDGYGIRIDKKDESGNIRGVHLFNHKIAGGNNEVINADSGRIEMANNDAYMKVILFSGVRSAGTNNLRSEEFSRSQFKKAQFYFDLSHLDMKETPTESFKQNRQMMNTIKLQQVIDSFYVDMKSEQVAYGVSLENRIGASFISKPDVLKKGLGSNPREVKEGQFKQAVKNALYTVQNLEYFVKKESNDQLQYKRQIARFVVEKHHRYTDAIACMILFLIGAPIGVLIKKGGMGWPALITVVSFILYYISFYNFEKLARAIVIEPIPGAWGGIISFIPFCIYFTFKAYKDARMFGK